MKHLRQPRRKAGAYHGFKDCNDEECEDSENDQAEEEGSAAGQEPGRGQRGFANRDFAKIPGFASAKCIFASFCKDAFAEILRFSKL